MDINQLLDISQWSDSLQARWNNLINESPGLVCIDFDNTLVRGDFGEQVMEWLLSRHHPLTMEYSRGYYSSPNIDSDLLLTLWGWNYDTIFRDPILARELHQSKDPKWKEFVFEEYGFIRETKGLGASYRWSSFIFSGWKDEEFRLLARNIWIENLESYKKNPTLYKSYPLPYPMAVHPREPLLNLIQTLNSLKWDVSIVTASPSNAIQETTPELGLDRTDVIGMRLETNQLGRTKSTIIEPYSFGTGKVEAIQDKHSKYPDIAFGDTVNDLPMLKSATRCSVLFQRGYNDLNTEALEHGIYIEDWI